VERFVDFKSRADSTILKGTDRKTWRGNMLKKRWPFSKLTKVQHRRAPIPKSIAAKFAVMRRRPLRN
jgi:hypothetical protein